MIDNYKTTDIVLAAYLRLLNYNMLTIEKTGQKGTFVFDSVDEEYVKLYDIGKASVEPITFNNMIKNLTTAVRRIV